MKQNTDAVTRGYSAPRLMAELFMACRFGIVGITATSVHILIVWSLVDTLPIPVLLSNFIAFLVAFGVSFSGNYFWTFRAPGNPKGALLRFLIISGGAFVTNTVLLAMVLRANWFSPALSAVASAAVIPMITYAASRLWGFKTSPSRSAEGVLQNNPHSFPGVRIGHTENLKMNFDKINSNFLLPFLLGAAAFFLVVGPGALNPENILWLQAGDPATHFLGWQFFRNGPWGFPLGSNPDYGLEFSNAVVYSDSIPLLAILFKLFSGLLTDTFQYFGCWLFACFVLQAWFGWKLTGLASNDRCIRFLATGLFVFSPPMLHRLNGHLSLVSHFLILAGLYLSLRKKQEMRIVYWPLLLAISAMVHAYILAMVALLWLVDLSASISKSPRTYQAPIKEFLTAAFFVFLACWQAGYFTVGQSMSSGGFGFFRMNLLSIIDSSGWSYILRDFPETARVGNGEGFNYLGLGLIVTVLFAIPTLFSVKTDIAGAMKAYPLLVLALLLLTAFSVSNNVGIGSWNFNITIPQSLLDVANIFRASGRMFWPVFYVLVFVAVFLVVRGYEKNVATSLLAIALVSQVIDTSAGWSPIRNKLSQNPASAEWASPLKDRFWATAAPLYKSVRLSIPRNIHPNWSVFADYAARNHLATNAVYLAREDEAKVRSAVQTSVDSIYSGKLDPDSLYILDDDMVAPALAHIDQRADLLAKIDGFNVLAPGYRRCAQCPQLHEELHSEEFVSPISLGERIDFSQAGKGRSFLLRGWSAPETWGTWSDGEGAGIFFPTSTGEAKSLLIEANALVSASHPTQKLEIRVNGGEPTPISLKNSGGNLIRLPLTEIASRRLAERGYVLLELKFINPARPKDIGINDDNRRLAIGLISVTLM